uniref:fibrinogen beta chain-like n=1 Tax=Ciona intestinalis TaxID=7719 RepID=UPI000EF4D9A5|nr:fibrinogen beta chain-like [Ciona intestinalis]|eukprot:XP_026690380.1 fibrinogen beta chain-like [Ciona intestinalis]
MYLVLKGLQLRFVIGLLISFQHVVTADHSSGASEVWSESTKPTRLVNILYQMCLNEVPIYVNATVKPSDSSLPHQFNLTVKRVEKYSFLVEILRTDLDSGWENILLTINWKAYPPKEIKTCRQLYDFGYRRNGLYNIYLDGSTKLEVYCDLENLDGGWTVIQRRVDNRTDFNRNWIDYKTGFGNRRASFWIGLENIRALTKNGDNELRIDITTCNNTKIVAEYSNFMVGPENDRYRLYLSGITEEGECGFVGGSSVRWPCGNTNISQNLCEMNPKGCCYDSSVLIGQRCFHTRVADFSRGSNEVWSESTKPTRLVNILYQMCLNEVPIYVKATVKPSDSSLPHQFNLTVKRVEKYSFLVEILRTDLDSGWENILLTVHWTAYMKAENCYQLYSFGHRRNGLYNIYLNRSTNLEVYCDLENRDGGWTVIQRNMDNRTDFDRVWVDYKTGFGNKLASFWIGLENIREMTKNGDNELRIDITTCDNTKIVAEYSNFMVGPESDRYRLNISGFREAEECGFNTRNRWRCPKSINVSQTRCEQLSAGCCSDSSVAGEERCFFTNDAMRFCNGYRFSTKDVVTKKKCPNSRKAGWWFNFCTFANLNGNYDPCKVGTRYSHWRRKIHASGRKGLRFTEMKIRPRRNY